MKTGKTQLFQKADEVFIPAIDFFVFECAGIAVISVLIWLYLLIVKKHAYNPFQPEEYVRCAAAMGETFGAMCFVFASEINPVFTAPITSFHCLLTIAMARLFLKERLSKRQYISLGFVVLGCPDWNCRHFRPVKNPLPFGMRHHYLFKSS